MPIKRPLLVNEEIYHIVVRGAGDAKIFRDETDRYRAIFSLYEFNTTTPVLMRDKRGMRNRIVRELFSDNSKSKGRDLLVEILAFCFMPNHIHLLLRQIRYKGITRFMRKLGAGYAMYFNQKYNRKGHLFQGRFRAVHVKANEQLRNTFVYIHTNSVSLIEPKWKERGVRDYEKAIQFLEEDRWSSYPDYIGRYNFPSVTERKFLLEVMGGVESAKRFVEDFIKYRSESKSEDNSIVIE